MRAALFILFVTACNHAHSVSVVASDSVPVPVPVSASASVSVSASACGPTHVSRLGDHATESPYLGPGDLLMDGAKAYNPETFAPATPPPSPMMAVKWTAIPGPDNTIESITENKTGKKLAIDAADARPDLGLAVDKSGRLVDLATMAIRTNALACGEATYSISQTGRFVICNAHGAATVIADATTKAEHKLGDGQLVLAPDDSYGIMLPGPFDGMWGHVETKRKTIDKVTWTAAPKTLGASGKVALGTAVYVVVDARHAIVRRACDDAIIFDDATAVPLGAAPSSPAAISESGKYLMLAGSKRAATFRIE